MSTSLTPAPNQSVLRLENYNRVPTKASRAGIAGYVTLGMVVVASFIGGSAYWATASKLDGAVVAPASFVVDGNRKTVEHIDGGTVREISVNNGDLVEAGQSLLALDSKELGFDLDVIASQIGDLSTRRARLLAQLEGAAIFEVADFVSSLKTQLAPADWQSAFATQKLLFDAEQRSRIAEDALTDQRITNLEGQIQGLEAQQAANARQLEIILQEVGNLETLLKEGLVAAARLNARRVEVERLHGVDAALRTQKRQTHNQIIELRLAAEGAKTLRAEALSTELTQVEASLASLEPQYAGAVERLKRVEIVAPVSGRIVDMKTLVAGGVVRPGEPILDIVPVDQPLIVEARVNTADIEALSVGQSTRVRLSAFDQGDVPEATGKIISISADRLEDDRTGQFYYLARAKLDTVQTDDVTSLELVPGMPADLFVNTGERTALSYLTQPLSERVARTFID